MNAARHIVRVCVFNGCARWCAAAFMMRALRASCRQFGELFGFFDLMVPLIQRMPLPAYDGRSVLAGACPALVNGWQTSWPLCCSRAAMGARVRGRCWPARCSSSGCVFELVYLPNPVSVIYLVIGLVQTACAVVMSRALAARGFVPYEAVGRAVRVELRAGEAGRRASAACSG